MGTEAGPAGQSAPPQRGSSPSIGKLLLLIGGLAVGGLLFLGAVVALWAYFFGREFVEDTQAIVEEGDAAGRTLDAEGCVNTALTRVDACRFYELRCRFKQQLFLQGCFQSSRALREYCENVPRSTQLIDAMRFRTQECTKRRQATSQGCLQLLQAVQLYCQNAREETGEE